MQHNHPNILSTSSLSKDNVRNREGKKLGDIKDFMIDLDSGHIVYAVLSFGGFLGMGDKLFAVPWEAFSIDEDNERFVMDIDKDVLENAPGFDKNDWPSRPNREFINRVHTHYGYESYYDEEGRTRRRTGTTTTGTTTRTP